MYLMYALAVGFAAWAVPVIEMLSKKRRNLTSWSFMLCSVSLYLAIYDTQRMVNNGVWGDIEDTHGGVLFGATVLLAVTVVLNLAAKIVKRKKNNS